MARHPSLLPGMPAPPFALRAQDGSDRTLAGYLAEGPLLLAFHRGTW
jgi:peroxiredoxin